MIVWQGVIYEIISGTGDKYHEKASFINLIISLSWRLQYEIT